MPPLVSCIISTYNRAHLITESLIYIQSQTYTNWECLIIDDGSTDQTETVIKKFLLEDKRFQYYKREGRYMKGLPGCRNQGLDFAKGRYIVFFDDDDIPHHQLLELSINELQKSQYDYCRYERITFRGDFNFDFKHISQYDTRIISINSLEAIILNELPFNSCQIVWRSSSISQERFAESLMFAEEWEFYTRLLSRRLTGISINETLYFARKHPDSNTGQFQNRDVEKIKSKIKASKLIIENLASKQLYYPLLKPYFIRLGFQLNSKELIEKALQYSGAGLTEKIKYRLGFYFYPALRPVFVLKGKLLFR